MKNNKPIQVFEYDRLHYGKTYNGNYFSEDHFDALVKYNERHDNKYFTVIHKGIRFQQYVGVIQVGKLTIEVLPKADRDHNPDKTKWQEVLFNMLRACRKIKLEGTEDADLKLRNASLIDLFIEQYLREVEEIIHKGLVKKYRQKESNKTALVGSLQFQKHLTHNLVHKERFFVRHQVYDTNHQLHKILNEALKIIPQVSTNPNFADKVERLLLNFSNLPSCKIQASTFEGIHYNRKTEHYQQAIRLAKLLLLNYSPDIQSGKENVLAILFDMNNLFEEYVYIKLRKEKGVEVLPQRSKYFWNSKKIKPDIVVKTASDTYILDTKWKALRTAKPSDADLKQMYAYQHYWAAHKTILLYPQVYGLKNKYGKFRQEDKECSLMFVEVVNTDGKLNEKIGEEILREIGSGEG
jgi:5-methylcytosine-specific restriction enzyme subunit McrC